MTALSPVRRSILVMFLLMTVAAIIGLSSIAKSPRNHASPANMELTTSAVQFRELANDSWATLDDQQQVINYEALRWNLLIDSVLLVPSYVGLFILFTLALSASPRHAWLRQFICVPAVAAGLFDLAENSMTAQALDDLIHRSLVDATVLDINLASRLKWGLIALALLMLCWRTWSALTGRTRWLFAGLFGLAGACLLAGTLVIYIPLLQTGLLFMVVGVCYMTWRQWRT